MIDTTDLTIVDMLEYDKRYYRYIVYNLIDLDIEKDVIVKISSIN